MDAVLLGAATLALAFATDPGAHAEPARVAPWVVVFAVLTGAGASALGFYRPAQPVTMRVLRALWVVPFSIAVFWLLPWPVQAPGKLGWQVAVLSVMVFVGAPVGAWAWPRLTHRRVVIVGTGAEASAVLAAVQALPRSEVVGCYPVAELAQEATAQPVLSGALSLSQTARTLQITDIVVALRERRGGVLPPAELLACRLAGVRVVDLSSFFERQRGQVRLDALNPSWLIYGEGFHQSLPRRAGKRVLDVVGALVLGALTAPLMALTALAIVLDSPGPVFYRQQRVGFAGRRFEVIKFRSMRTDAERDGTPRWATAGDARITRVGHFIRRFRIDELPQLWCVLRGQMSLIGPRPERPYFVAQLTEQVPFYALRHSVKPGLTGWAQVRYQYGESIADAIEKLQYDLYYVKRGGLWLDVKILLATVKVVLTGQGAH